MLTQDDIDHLRGWIGRGETLSGTLSQELVDRFRASFDMPVPEGEALPQLLHFCLAQPVAPTAALAVDGHPEKGGFLPPVPLPRRMWAGGEILFHAPLVVGAPVRRHSEIADVQVKQGRSGTLCFVTVRHRIESGGELAITERQDIVYRAARGGTPAVPDDPQPRPADRRRSVTPSETLLFRYSALTFNAHRIHYDHPYTTGTEGYAGLVVHGPMQATLLCQFAADLASAPLTRFSFRSTAPILGTAPFDLCADLSEGVARLWTARPGGPVAMAAEARW
ncbi:MaoC family dehydratase N-terminal domain-containing protein [Salipiger sp. P9]|uniref:FAS1-like dehydratase domain-containing protein n=1 Tax=Salipiger pentaromativorans TaxID=2943193 RepID=UPI0021583664|nr:MaoC family dehydratase N-terminal domain-containing protein [Salipiger pentaromativorans]MCR8551034.1 MaoC family dehydratase N-terminal domain-containing protein [Salipiger pentaromativorans]